MAEKHFPAIDTLPMPDRRVRVVVPVKVAFDLTSMQKVTTRVLERLGCPQCHSGFDIRFDIARRFQFDDKLNMHELSLPEGGIIIDL